MNNEKPFDLKERTFLFAKAVLRFANNIKYNQTISILIDQRIRAATSVGANFEEASESFTRKEFIYKAAIAKKEAKESNYWLRLLKESELVQFREPLKLDELIQESKELVKILNSMIIRR